MAKQPRYQVDARSLSGGGPMAVTPTNTDAPGRALAGLGSQMRQTGRFLTAEAKEAEERTRRLQQQTEISRFGLDAVQDFNKLREDLATVQDPDARYPRYEQALGTIRARLDAIADPDVRSQAETWLNQESAVWDADVRTGTQTLRVKQADDHLNALAEDAVDRRDISQIEMYATQLAEGGFISEQQKADMVGRYDAKIRTELAKDEVAGIVQRMDARTAIEYLNGPQASAALQGLDPQDRQQYLEQQIGLIGRQQAQAAQQARLVEQQREANGRQWLARANTGQAVDLNAMWKEVQDFRLDPAVANQVQTVVAKGARTENDPQTFMAAEAWLSKIRQTPAEKGDGLIWLQSHASKLTNATWQQYVQAFERAGDPADPLSDPQYRLLDGLLDENFFVADGKLTFGQHTGPQAELSYILAKEQFRNFRRENPTATGPQMLAEYQRLIAVPEQISTLEQIRKNFFGRILLGPKPRGSVRMSPEGMRRYGYTQETATMTPEGEPRTQQEFEDRVKAFAPGSAAQVEYYRKWADKWR